MRKLILLAVAFLLLAAPAFASTDQNIDVTVTIPDYCEWVHVGTLADLVIVFDTDTCETGQSDAETLEVWLCCNDPAGFTIDAEYNWTSYQGTYLSIWHVDATADFEIYETPLEIHADDPICMSWTSDTVHDTPISLQFYAKQTDYEDAGDYLGTLTLSLCAV